MTKRVVLFGECMLELRQQSADTLSKSFAGDAYNTAIYLSRMNPNIQSSFMTAVGHDAVSTEMQQRMIDENLDTEFVFKHKTKKPGLYLITNDDSGERNFTYWRSDSAAKCTIATLKEAGNERYHLLLLADVFMFTGISLAIMNKSDREMFWGLIRDLKANGTQIVFDANYRPALWESIEDTQSQYNLAFTHSHIVLPGLEDLTAIYGHTSAQQALAFLGAYEIQELILKDGLNGVQFVDQTDELATTGFVAVTPVAKVIDTTSAGDAFNGGYLASRLSGESIENAIKKACEVSAYVIQCPGAIAPKKAFNDCFKMA